MKIAIVQDNIVFKIITVSTEEEYIEQTKQYPLAIDITDANPMPAEGWLWDGNKLNDPLGSATPTRKITKLGLRRRLTTSELVALTAAAKSNDLIAALKDNLTVATYVDLNRPDTIAAVGVLVTAGLLTSDRANTILSAPIQEDERYKGLE